MAGRNAINKPKIKMHAHSHAKSLGRKRAARRTVATRSSTSRYAAKGTTAPRPTDSKAVALYTGETPGPTSIMTTSTLSNKRAKKIARNQKYFAANKASANELPSMEVDNVSPEEKQTKLDQVKKALWSVIENHSKNGYPIVADPEGTTLGIQSF
ncbi:ALB1 Ribosome biogenesis protein ALB1 [Candida maltosa Xu316]|uniref:Ribosome biogenesis protein ALB1 n=1 Tax=Candida maltosa (strain Xu316) TaxID=1245528 RepID=M3JYC2_CANMX|nr:Ribosome biogenesis protein ALB1 [Candida maltosa Xu316]